ncbi:hypothetical protein B0T11DRAFT_345459 [Plectosphaerella cucumerina]|uniref:Uncharacterized protein n=1 Tax=Plectosphaerella cucumerina TaxID=40658 RepID=A0A8K0X8K5_9PEZI|nr:hypothetical protein B0T11DRAFT_345459 [Plectosphaerella cucumerina]
MRAATFLSTLFALSASVTAMPTPGDNSAETAALEARGACDKGYYPCVQLQQFACPLGCMAVHAPIAKLSCLQNCNARAHANCAAWCS